MVVPFVKFTTKKWVVLANKIDQLFIGVGIMMGKDKHYSIHNYRYGKVIRK